MKRASALLCMLTLLMPADVWGQTAKRKRAAAKASPRSQAVMPVHARTLELIPLSGWPAVRNYHGYAGPESGAYVLEAASNTWVGPGRMLPLNAVLEGDLLFKISFVVAQKEDCSLQITLSDAGTDYSQLSFYLELWQSGTPTYSAYENWVQKNFYSSVKRTFAERRPLPELAGVDWSKVNTLAILRQGASVSLALNGQVLGSFQAPTFPVSQFALGLAFKSKVVITSAAAGALGK